MFHAGQRLSLLEHLLLREGTFLLLVLPLFVFLLFLVFIHLRDKRVKRGDTNTVTTYKFKH